uniref:Uncharacterized protein n=1 Tax=Ralstonia syzygii R24 TaxID=907261 RepID=G3AB36_9RALS|nr:hypothetical protein RALSY_mp30034 [Ralstonia syzygii R24]
MPVMTSPSPPARSARSGFHPRTPGTKTATASIARRATARNPTHHLRPNPSRSITTIRTRNGTRGVVIGTLSPDFPTRALRPMTLPSGRTDDAYATVNGGFQD